MLGLLALDAVQECQASQASAHVAARCPRSAGLGAGKGPAEKHYQDDIHNDGERAGGATGDSTGGVSQRTSEKLLNEFHIVAADELSRD